ncbi:MAG: hypothetical protein ACE5KX_05310 [Acidimicrobiia bacterium]
MPDSSAGANVDTAKKAALKKGPAGRALGIDELARAVVESNKNEFLKAARSRRFAFAIIKWMFLIVFLLGIGAFVAAVSVATDVTDNWARAGVAGVLALFSAALFAIVLFVKPLAALERNSVVSSFLTVVVNSYWTRLIYVDRVDDVDVYLESATAYTTSHLGALLDRQLLGSSKFMNLVRQAQDEAGQDPGAYTSPL